MTADDIKQLVGNVNYWADRRARQIGAETAVSQLADMAEPLASLVEAQAKELAEKDERIKELELQLVALGDLAVANWDNATVGKVDALVKEPTRYKDWLRALFRTIPSERDTLRSQLAAVSVANQRRGVLLGKILHRAYETSSYKDKGHVCDNRQTVESIVQMIEAHIEKAPVVAGNTASPKHPHEPEIPPVLDAEGRCLICCLQVKLTAAESARDSALSQNERLRGALEELRTIARKATDPEAIRRGDASGKLWADAVLIRTDAALSSTPDDTVKVLREEVERLKATNAEDLAKLAEAVRMGSEQAEQFDRLLSEARKDSERIETLAKIVAEGRDAQAVLWAPLGPGDHWRIETGPLSLACGDTLRAALDSAREEKGPSVQPDGGEVNPNP